LHTLAADRMTRAMLRLILAVGNHFTRPAERETTLLVIGLIAALLGFGGIAGTAVGLAKIVFLVAMVLLVVSLIFGGMRGSFGRRL
jgi:uncharacterized membrane protein YtjA (UPF0391 family)